MLKGFNGPYSDILTVLMKIPRKEESRIFTVANTGFYLLDCRFPTLNALFFNHRKAERHKSK